MILFSGTAQGAAREAQQILADEHDVAAELWSVTSYKALREDALAAVRWNRLHPTELTRMPYVTEALSNTQGPFVAVTDFMKAVPDQVARWIPGNVITLGTDGYGRSDSRAALRRHFETDTAHVVVAVLAALADTDDAKPEEVADAIAHYGLDPDARRAEGGVTAPTPAGPMRRVGVVGCGLMGSGIAEVCARAGLDVIVREVDTDAVAAGKSRIAKSLARATRKAKLTDEEAAAAVARIRYTTDFADLSDRQLVLEAVSESEPLKLDVFATLDKVVADDAILASNTSAIPIMKLAMATGRPDQVVGLHFFSPVPVLTLVELVSSLLTSDATADATQTFAEDVLGKKVIRAKDRAGFIVNALLIPYLISAIRMLESGFATVDDIDSGMVLGCNHPMGPLALADFIGLDTTMAAAESLYEEFKEPLFAPPPLLSRMVEAGLLGRKTGRGFYVHNGTWP